MQARKNQVTVHPARFWSQTQLRGMNQFVAAADNCVSSGCVWGCVGGGGWRPAGGEGLQLIKGSGSTQGVGGDLELGERFSKLKGERQEESMLIWCLFIRVGGSRGPGQQAAGVGLPPPPRPRPGRAVLGAFGRGLKLLSICCTLWPPLAPADVPRPSAHLRPAPTLLWRVSLALFIGKAPGLPGLGAGKELSLGGPAQPQPGSQEELSPAPCIPRGKFGLRGPERMGSSSHLAPPRPAVWTSQLSPRRPHSGPADPPPRAGSGGCCGPWT